MFERFTDRARRVVVLAQEESRLLNHNHIGVEHILIALAHEGGVAAAVLEDFELSAEKLRTIVRTRMGSGTVSPSGHIPFTVDAKKALEMSLRACVARQDNHIGPEHILLGLAEPGGAGAALLEEISVDPRKVIEMVNERLGGSAAGAGVLAAPGLLAEPVNQETMALFDADLNRIRTKFQALLVDNERLHRLLAAQTTIASTGEAEAVDTGAGVTQETFPLCSFCNKGQREVRKLVAGPGVYICDECVELSAEVIAESAAPPPLAKLEKPASPTPDEPGEPGEPDESDGR